MSTLVMAGAAIVVPLAHEKAAVFAAASCFMGQ